MIDHPNCCNHCYQFNIKNIRLDSFDSSITDHEIKNKINNNHLSHLLISMKPYWIKTSSNLDGSVNLFFSSCPHCMDDLKKPLVEEKINQVSSYEILLGTNINYII